MPVERHDVGRAFQHFEHNVLEPKLEELREEIFEKMGETKTDGIVLTEYMKIAKENVILENKVEKLENTVEHYEGIIKQKDLEIRREREAKDYFRREWKTERSKITPTNSNIKFSASDNILFVVFVLLVLLGGLKVGELIATLIGNM